MAPRAAAHRLGSARRLVRHARSPSSPAAARSGGAMRGGRRRGDGPLPRATSVAAPATEVELLKGVSVVSADTGEAVDLASLVPAQGRCVLALLTQFGDFDAVEAAQRYVDELAGLDAEGVALVCVGIGSVEAARKMADLTGFPRERLFADAGAASHAALGCAPGWGREGGPGAWAASIPAINGYVKLMVMCAGIGSPGTLKEVIRGYTGDRDVGAVFNQGTNVDIPWRVAFDVLGKGYQRPFERATLRLNNMIAVLSDWETLAPEDTDLLVQRGTTLIVENGATAYRADDCGILTYAPPSRVARKALQEDPGAVPDPIGTLHEAAKTRKADSEDVFKVIRDLERKKEKDVSLAKLNGQWKLQWTTGTKEVAANLQRRADGSYFPIRAVQSFNAEAQTIRNGVYVGPAALYFDGEFRFRERQNVLEFTFLKVSLKLGSLGPWSMSITDDKWDALKAAEQEASDGQGNIEKGKAGKVGANPFFKFVLADDECCAARGRGGGLALWARESFEPVPADAE